MVPSLGGLTYRCHLQTLITSVPLLCKNMGERLGFNLYCEVTSVRVCDKAAGDEIHNSSQMLLPSAASTGIYSNHLPSCVISHSLCQLPPASLERITVNVFPLHNISFLHNANFSGANQVRVCIVSSFPLNSNYHCFSSTVTRVDKHPAEASATSRKL